MNDVELSFVLGAMTKSRFVDITPWSGSEREKTCTVFEGGRVETLRFNKFVCIYYFNALWCSISELVDLRWIKA